MSLSRRDFVRLTGLIAAGAAAAGACSPLYGELSGAYRDPQQWPAGEPSIFRALSRLTFGPTAPEVARVAEIGLAGWLEEQLSPDTVGDAATEILLRRHEVVSMEANALQVRDRDDVLLQFRAAGLQRKIYSSRQLLERWYEFWTDHFNISVDKGDCWYLKVADDRQVIREHGWGQFESLLNASAHSPAMLVYLDNQANEASAPNENYARELMELHTLGVDGGYSQADVMQLARCLTGWSVKDHFWNGEFTFKQDLHDPGRKQVLGLTIDPGGETEAERVLSHLAGHPATARHLAHKLVGRFIGDHPERSAGEVVEMVANRFMRSGGDLQATARTLLLDGLLPRVDRLAPKIKRPIDFVVSSLRALAAHSDGGWPLQRHLAAMGQLPHAWPTPDGAPDEAESWEGNLLPRWQFALELVQDGLEGTLIDVGGLRSADGVADEGLLAALSRRLLGTTPNASLVAAAEAALRESGSEKDDVFAELLIAGLIASPGFQWR
jgi:uncharacterized protein (DUF1800 family)